MTKYPENPEIIRNFAEFLDTIEGHNEEAETFYSLANMLEEKELRAHNKKKILANATLTTSMTRKAKRQSLGDVTQNEFAPINPLEGMDKEPEPEVSGSEVSSQEDSSQPHDSSSILKSLPMGAAASEKHGKSQPKKEYMKKLNSKEDHFTFRMLFFVFPLVSIIVCIIALVIAVYLINYQHVNGLYMKTKLSAVPTLILSIFRFVFFVFLFLSRSNPIFFSQ